MNSPPNEIDERTQRELAALADGSLGGHARARLEQRAAESPALADALERQRAAVAALRGLDLRAPAGLRTRIEGERGTRPAPVRRRRLAIGGSLAGAAAAAALVAALVLPSGAGEPSLGEAAALAELPATEAAVAVDPANPKLLDAAVEGVPFPNLEGEFGWRQAGARSDELDGREARTVFYERGGSRIAYTIVSGEPISAPEGGAETTLNGVDLTSLSIDGESGGEGQPSAPGEREVVTWLREGRTCVLSAGDEVSFEELRTLASWKGDGAVPF